MARTISPNIVATQGCCFINAKQVTVILQHQTIGVNIQYHVVLFQLKEAKLCPAVVLAPQLHVTRPLGNAVVGILRDGDVFNAYDVIKEYWMEKFYY